MNNQSMQANGETIGVFDDKQSALKVQTAIASSGIPVQKISIDNSLSANDRGSLQPLEKARGTTTGGKAGLLVGGFYGGVLGIAASVIVPYWVDSISLNSPANRLLLVGITLVGAAIGFVYGNRALLVQKQKQTENLLASTPFRLIVRGSQDEIAQARRVLMNEMNEMSA